jgi:two-component system sensor kinase
LYNHSVRSEPSAQQEDRRTAGDRKDIWYPTAIGLVGVMVSLAIWGVLVGERRARILASTREGVAETEQAVEAGLARQVATLRGLQDLSERFGLPADAAWRDAIAQRFEQSEGLVAVALVDARHPASRADVVRPGFETRIELEAVDLALRPGDGPRLVGPLRSDAGDVAYRIELPLRTADGHVGVLAARFDATRFLESVLQARASGYAVEVRWAGDEPIFTRGVPSQDRWQRWWRAASTIDLPTGGSWRVVQRPTPELAAAWLTPIPHYLLAAGMLLSAVLAALAHELRVIIRQSQVLAQSNRALEERSAELEDRVAERTEALREAVSELEAFNYSVSHDLRSPLGAILNFTSILEEDYRERPLDDEGIDILERIRRSASRATALLEDLLQLSRAGRSALTPERIDMSGLARETFAQVRAAEEDGGEDVELVVASLPEAVGDRSLLGDVFANLFSNAFKYSRGCEKRRITVDGRIEGGECLYEVADNGQGFDMRYVDKLFGLFERLHADDEVEGTGVGLAMVARIVQRHGGRVWAEGRPGEGARFGFALPRREVAP